MTRCRHPGCHRRAAPKLRGLCQMCHRSGEIRVLYPLRKRPWTRLEDSFLLHWQNEGRQAPEISTLFGHYGSPRTPKAVNQRLQALSATEPFPGKRRPGELARLVRRLCKSLTDTAAAARLGVGRSAVSNTRRRLGLAGVRTRGK